MTLIEVEAALVLAEKRLNACHEEVLHAKYEKKKAQHVVNELAAQREELMLADPTRKRMVIGSSH